MSDSALPMVQNLSLVTFNCKGFNNGLSYLPVLLDSFDVILLQEHWLSDSEFDCLCFDGFISSAISGFDNSVLLRGRPFGGCAILYRQNLVSSFKQVSTCSRRFCAVKIVVQNCCCLLINVYLPTDYRSTAATDQLKATLGELYGFISTVPHDFLIIAGDWNTDLHRPCSFTDVISSFVYDLNLSFVDLNFSDDVQFTYLGHDGSKSWLDHVAVSTPCVSLVTSVHSIMDGRNLSDHNPLVLSLDLSVVSVVCPPVAFKTTCPAWFKATPEIIGQYQSSVLQSLAALSSSLDDEVVLCCNPLCTAHHQHLELICGQLVKCLKEAAESSIPCRGSGRRRKVAGWSEFVKPELVASQWWYKLWLDAGSPSAGVLFQLKKLAHRRYKYAVRRVRRREEHIKCSRLAEAMINDPNRSFWSEAQRFFGKRASAFAPVVDNVSGPDDVAKLWRDNFRKLYNTVDGSASTELLNTLDVGISSTDIEQISVSSHTVREAIGKLKRGKSDGGSLVSDHIIEAPTAICDFLARVFTSVLRHGFMPAAFRDATIQPIPKGSKDPSASSNYRGIALASSLSKVLEWSILLSWKQFFSTSELQFGFKSGFSTTLCTGVMKAVISRYMKRGSKVYACLIDASKAFDLVDHSVLFEKLLERNMPKPLVRLLLRWYKTQHLCVRWMGKSSDYFQVSNGVRQGGVLSPILFTIYMDSLLELLRACGRGCYWEDHFSGAMCYADDLTILAPCPDALRKMLVHCEEYAESHGIRFNASKTQLICFRRSSSPDSSHFRFCGQLLPLVDSVLHLGNTLCYDLSDRLDVQRKTMAFIRQANSVLCRFKATDPFTKMRLLQSYCLSLYGCSLWRLDCSALHSLNVSFNQVIRRIWSLPCNAHTAIVHSVGLTDSLFNIVFARFSKLYSSAVSHSSPLVRSVFVVSAQTCNSNFIGYNLLYGRRHCKTYSTEDAALGRLIREIRSAQIPNFSLTELDTIVISAST